LSDTFFVGSGTNGLNDVHGSVTIDNVGGTDTLTVRDDGSSAMRTYTVSDGTIAPFSLGAITYKYMATATLKTSKGDAYARITSPAPTTVLTVQGGPGSNTIVGPDTDNAWNITGAN